MCCVCAVCVLCVCVVVSVVVELVVCSRYGIVCEVVSDLYWEW